MEEQQQITFQECNGLLFPRHFVADAIRSALEYKPKKNDLFLVTYPKCGTTWMQYISLLILRKGQPLDESDTFLNTPFLELTGADAVDLMTDTGVICTHIPMNRLHFSPSTKYIYVARNPKDCCVSFYHHMKGMPFLNYQDGTFDDFFERFLEGKLPWGDYFDHLIPWYQRRGEPNVYFTTYEKLKENLKEEVINIARFFGEEYETAILGDNWILENIVQFSSIDYMKQHRAIGRLQFYKKLIASSGGNVTLPSGIRYIIERSQKSEERKIPKNLFIRKGIVGDWKNYFSSEQNERMKKRIAEKTAGSDVMKLWDGF